MGISLHIIRTRADESSAIFKYGFNSQPSYYVFNGKAKEEKSRNMEEIFIGRLIHGIYHLYIPSTSTQTSSFNLSQERLENVC